MSRKRGLLRPVSSSSMAATTADLGPLCFHPLPATLTPLLSSPSLSPPCLPPPPALSMRRFLQTSSSVLPMTAANISASFLAGDSLPLPFAQFAHNCLQPLRCPDGRSTLVFFPAGDNLDHIGYLLLSVIDSQLVAQCSVCVSSESFAHKIIQFSACGGNDDDDSLGFLMASTMYCVHWFRVRVSGRGSDHQKPFLVYLGNNKFSSSIAHVCWNPHSSSGCVVLLESGRLFLFNVNGSVKRITVPWDQHGVLKNGGWFSCEFSCHYNSLVAAHSDAVFCVDWRFGK